MREEKEGMEIVKKKGRRWKRKGNEGRMEKPVRTGKEGEKGLVRSVKRKRERHEDDGKN